MENAERAIAEGRRAVVRKCDQRAMARLRAKRFSANVKTQIATRPANDVPAERKRLKRNN